MKKIFSSQVLSVLMSSLFLVMVVKLVLAAPPTTPFLPGETLDPACLPDDTNCTVAGLTSEFSAFLQTPGNAPTLLATVPLAEEKLIRVQADVIVEEADQSARHFLSRSSLFYRNSGGNVTQQGSSIGGFGQIVTGGLLNFGNGTSQYDITVDAMAGVVRFTWDGNGTDPNFASNGLEVGMGVNINSPSFNEPPMMGDFTVSVVTDDYFEVGNPDVTTDQNDVSDVTITAVAASPSIELSANSATDTIDVTVTGLSGEALSWNARIETFEVSSQ